MSNSRYNQSLLDRIDNMESDKDFNPYNAEKKHTVNHDELFNEEVYMSQDEYEEFKDNQKKDDEDETFNNLDDSGSPIAVGIVVAIIIVIVIAGFILFLKNIL